MDLPKTPKKMPTKPKGAERRLCCVTYSQIAAWVGLAKRTVIEYASLGHFDSRSLESILGWVNGRRKARGLPPVGHPEKIAELDTLENVTQQIGGE